MNVQAAPSWVPPYLVPFVTLSYPVDPPAQPDSFPNSSYYGTGLLDACFVVAWIAFLGVARDFVRLKVFEPFARWYLVRQDEQYDRARAASRQPDEKSPAPKPDAAPSSSPSGTKKPSKRDIVRERSVMRFAEQGYQWLYFSIYWSYGAYVHFQFPHSPWKLDYLWIGYPHIPLAAPVKLYYITQLAFWLHSVLVLNAEARRKDHVQMMTHHVVTIPLIALSYMGNYTRIGCLILFLMDWCDIWLAFAKMMRYLGFVSFCDVVFGVWVLSWIATRQVAFFIIIVSVYYCPIELGWDSQRGHYLTRTIHITFLGFLLSLMAMMCMWASMMFTVVYKVLRGQPAEDVRSDDDDEEIDESDPKSADNDLAKTPSVLEPVSSWKKNC